MDRIDLHLNVPAVDVNKLMADKENIKREGSREIKKRVVAGRLVQNKRFESADGVFCNADMKNRHIRQFALMTTKANLLLKQAVNKYALSARTYFRLIKVSRTIADLAGSKNIEDVHVAEALQYRIRLHE